MRKISVFLLVLITGTTSFSRTSVTVHGILVSYDAKYARIRTSKNHLIKVPLRSLKTPVKGLIVGKATVQAKLSSKKLLRLNKKRNKK